MENGGIVWEGLITALAEMVGMVAVAIEVGEMTTMVVKALPMAVKVVEEASPKCSAIPCCSACLKPNLVT
jgi:hypothetical protein